MRYFSTFTGIGGFEVGIERADPAAEFVGYSEINPYAAAIYDYHYKNKGVRNYGDITKIKAETLPEFECLVGGYPCQAFSIAGKQRGFEDTRGTLFFDLARILRAKRPRLFVFENVRNLVSHDHGRTFATMLATLDELGYCVQWQVMDSRGADVPQHRERVIIVGNYGKEPLGPILPIRRAESETAKKIGEIGRGRGFLDGRAFDVSGSAPTLTVVGTHEIRIRDVDGRYRRITPVEAERLQGFDDDWTKYGLYEDGVHEMSDTRRYQACGNAVTTKVVELVMRRIMETIDD